MTTKKEYREYHGKPEHIKERAEGNKARREIGLKKGDPREVDHIKPFSKGGNTELSNAQLLHRHCNREKNANNFEETSINEVELDNNFDDEESE